MGPASDDDPQPHALPSTIKIWEAYARGLATVTQVNVNIGGSASPIGYRVDNFGNVEVLVDEMVMLLSPHPLNDFANPDLSTQDGTLTQGSVAPSSSLTYFYGGLQSSQYEPEWWCTEDSQMTQAGRSIILGGEILPFDMENIIETSSAPPGEGPLDEPQDDIAIQDLLWAYMRTNPTLVVGKTPLWTEISDDTEAEIDLTLSVTNIGFPPASSATLVDTIPAGYSMKAGSASPSPDLVITLPDGSQEVRWTVSLDGASADADGDGLEREEGFANDGIDNDGDGLIDEDTYLMPTTYDNVKVAYTLVTPPLPEGRYFLPRAQVDTDGDAVMDAHSAEPLVEAIFKNDPPLASAGGPYLGDEGQPITFDGSGSLDPNGDTLEYRWDFDSDGTFEVNWNPSPTGTHTWGDDLVTSVTLEVRDGEYVSADTVQVVVGNLAPTAEPISWTAATNAPRTVGYWGHQCDLKKLNENHAGILQSWVDAIGSQSLVFPAVSDIESVCAILEDTGGSDMLIKAQRQLMALWLNVVSGKLDPASQVELPSLTAAATVETAIEDIEAVLTSGTSDRAELERAKDIADSINNGIGVAYAVVTFTASGTDPGSDDLTFSWDFGDGVAASTTYFNDGVAPDPPDSPGGAFPFAAANAVEHTYFAPGDYTIILTLLDDDGGSHQVTLLLSLGG
jgi:hypothetical protein